MKVLAVAIIIVALVIIIVPQLTNCEYGKDNAAAPAMDMGGIGSSTEVTYASMEETPEAMSSAEPMATPAATGMVAKMKCYWSAHAEIVAGVPLIAIGLLLLFARRKETTRVLGVLTAVIGVLTMLIPTTLIGTCLNDQMVCNTEMKPTLLITGGITVALGVAVLVLGEMKRENDGSGPAAAA